MKYLIVLGYRDPNTKKTTYTNGFCKEMFDGNAARIFARKKEIEYLRSLNVWKRIVENAPTLEAAAKTFKDMIAYMVCWLHDYVNLPVVQVLPWEIIYQEYIFYKEEYHD